MEAEAVRDPGARSRGTDLPGRSTSIDIMQKTRDIALRRPLFTRNVPTVRPKSIETRDVRSE